MIATAGGKRSLRSITVRTRGRQETIAADALGVSGGWNPNLHLTCHHGGRAALGREHRGVRAGAPPPGMTVVGAANGTMTLARLPHGGHRRRHSAPPRSSASRTASARSAERRRRVVRGRRRSGMSAARAEGLRRPAERRHRRRRGAGGARGLPLGRAPQALHHARHGDRPGPDRQRQRPRHHGGADRPHHRGDRHHHVPAALHAGRDRRVRGPPSRPSTSARRGCTPSHAWANEQGAVFVETGPWLRAQYFPRAGERDWLETVDREVRTVRAAVGFCDVSTLGKIEVHGPDAGAFLDRLYINTFSTLPVGRARYGVMLREDGFVLDDGTTSRLGDDRFFMTTTTANAGARVPAHAVLPPGAVAGARRAVRLGDRPVGAVLGRGAARPRYARAARRSAVRYRQRRLPASWRRPS